MSHTYIAESTEKRRPSRLTMYWIAPLLCLNSMSAFAQSISIDDVPTLMPRNTPLGAYSPLIRFNYEDLQTDTYTLKVWLLSDPTFNCSSNQWCEREFVIDNTSGTNSSGSITVIQNMDVFDYEQFDWVIRLLNSVEDELDSDERLVAGTSNRAPVLDPLGDQLIGVGTPFGLLLKASDSDNDDVTFDAAELPIGATLDPDTGIFQWTPSELGSFPVTFFAVDSGEGKLRDAEGIVFSVTDLPPSDGTFSAVSIAGGFSGPTDIAVSPIDDTIFVAEKRGMVWLIQDGVRLTTPVVDIIDEVNNSGDRGLLAIALNPDFQSVPYLYMFFAVDPVFGQPDEPEQDATFGRLIRYQLAGSSVIESSREILLEGMPFCGSSHSTGALKFGWDGMLYISVGDGGEWAYVDNGMTNGPGDEQCEMFGAEQDIGALRALSLGSLAGKILRVDPTTGLGLPDNPFFNGDPSSTESRIWAMGFRNPFRFIVSQDSRAYVADVGWGDFEEITAISAGESAGWPCWEGPEPQVEYQEDPITGPDCQSIDESSLIAPLLSYHHTDASYAGFIGNSASGLSFYHAASYPPEFQGGLFISDFAQGWIKVLHLDSEGELESVQEFLNVTGPVDLEVHPYTGNLIYASVITGEVREIVFLDAVNPVARASASTLSGSPPLLVSFSSNMSKLAEGTEIKSIAWDFGDGSAPTHEPNPTHEFIQQGVFAVALTIVDAQGGFSTDSLTIDTTNEAPAIQIVNPSDGYIFLPNESIKLRAIVSDAEDGAAIDVMWEVQIVHTNHIHPQQNVYSEAQPTVPLSVHGNDTEHYSYRIVATATDSSGLRSNDFVDVFPSTLTSNDPPQAAFAMSLVPGGPPYLVEFDASNSSDPNQDLLSYDWTFGDGQVGDGEQTTHFFNQSGNYEVVLKVLDHLDGIDTLTETLAIPSAVALCDPGFEESTPDGTQPDSGCWTVEWFEAGDAIVTLTAAKSGANGLWVYTGGTAEDSFVFAKQEVAITPGYEYEAQAYGRANPDSWPDSGRGFMEMMFLDSAGSSLGSFQSSPILENDVSWQLLSVSRQPAPSSATTVRIALYVEKSVGENGVAVVNFDEVRLFEFVSENKDGGCFKTGNSSPDNKKLFGDLFLLGLLSIAFVAWRGLLW